jgi:hypothetical protein
MNVTLLGDEYNLESFLWKCLYFTHHLLPLRSDKSVPMWYIIYAAEQVSWDERKCNVGLPELGVRGGAVGWGTALQTGRSRVRLPTESRIFQWLNPSGRIVALGSTQPLTEMSTRHHSWG